MIEIHQESKAASIYLVEGLSKRHYFNLCVFCAPVERKEEPIHEVAHELQRDLIYLFNFCSVALHEY